MKKEIEWLLLGAVGLGIAALVLSKKQSLASGAIGPYPTLNQAKAAAKGSGLPNVKEGDFMGNGEYWFSWGNFNPVKGPYYDKYVINMPGGVPKGLGNLS